MAAKKSAETIAIRPLDIKSAKIRIVGDTPLIVHAWDQKAAQMMLDAQQGKKIEKKEYRRPFREFVNSLYWLTDMPEDPGDDEGLEENYRKILPQSKFGFRICAVKQAANSAAYRLGWVKNQMALRGAYFLHSDYGEMFEIEGSDPIERQDFVRIGTGSADLRYRAQFDEWAAVVTLEYNASSNLRLNDIINCLNAGGSTCGLGEWRPERDGDYGRFHVETA